METNINLYFPNFPSSNVCHSFSICTKLPYLYVLKSVNICDWPPVIGYNDICKKNQQRFVKRKFNQISLYHIQCVSDADISHTQ